EKCWIVTEKNPRKIARHPRKTSLQIRSKSSMFPRPQIVHPEKRKLPSLVTYDATGVDEHVCTGSTEAFEDDFDSGVVVVIAGDSDDITLFGKSCDESAQLCGIPRVEV